MEEAKKFIIRKAEVSDGPAILELLTKNLYKNLSPEDRGGGFVIFEPTAQELEKIINDVGIILSFSGNELEGYLMVMSKKLALTFAFEKELLTYAEQLKYQGKFISEYNYILLAQICIAKEARGKGTLKQLHQAMRIMLKDKGYEIGIGEIADTNSKSLGVHGFMIEVGTYTDSSRIKWHVVIADPKI